MSYNDYSSPFAERGGRLRRQNYNTEIFTDSMPMENYNSFNNENSIPIVNPTFAERRGRLGRQNYNTEIFTDSISMGNYNSFNNKNSIPVVNQTYPFYNPRVRRDSSRRNTFHDYKNSVSGGSRRNNSGGFQQGLNSGSWINPGLDSRGWRNPGLNSGGWNNPGAALARLRALESSIEPFERSSYEDPNEYNVENFSLGLPYEPFEVSNPIVYRAASTPKKGGGMLVPGKFNYPLEMTGLPNHSRIPTDTLGLFPKSYIDYTLFYPSTTENYLTPRRFPKFTPVYLSNEQVVLDKTQPNEIIVTGPKSNSNIQYEHNMSEFPSMERSRFSEPMRRRGEFAIQRPHATYQNVLPPSPKRLMNATYARSPSPARPMHATYTRSPSPQRLINETYSKRPPMNVTYSNSSSPQRPMNVTYNRSSSPQRPMNATYSKSPPQRRPMNVTYSNSSSPRQLNVANATYNKPNAANATYTRRPQGNDTFIKEKISVSTTNTTGQEPKQTKKEIQHTTYMKSPKNDGTFVKTNSVTHILNKTFDKSEAKESNANLTIIKTHTTPRRGREPQAQSTPVNTYRKTIIIRNNENDDEDISPIKYKPPSPKRSPIGRKPVAQSTPVQHHSDSRRQNINEVASPVRHYNETYNIEFSPGPLVSSTFRY